MQVDGLLPESDHLRVWVGSLRHALHGWHRHGDGRRVSLLLDLPLPHLLDHVSRLRACFVLLSVLRFIKLALTSELLQQLLPDEVALGSSR